MSSFSEYNVSQFKVEQKCSACGGEISFQSGFCIYCGSEYKEVKDSYHKLEAFLLLNMENDIPLDMSNAYNLIFLYSIQNLIHSDILDKFLKIQKVEEKIQIFMKKINDKMLNNNYLNKEENYIFTILLDRDVLNSNQVLGHYIMKSIFLRKPLVAKDTFLAIVKQMTVETMKIINAGRIPNYHPQCMIKHMREEQDVNGSAFMWYTVNFDYDMLSEFYEGNILNFQAFFHEIDHIQDAINIYSGAFSMDIVKHIQEKVIRQIEVKQAFLEKRQPTYYDKNYGLISYEKDAQIHGFIAFKRYLDMLEIGISQELNETIQNEINYEIKQKENLLRTIDGTEFTKQNSLTVDEIFEYMVEDHPEYLNKYSQLRIGYIVDNGKVRCKTNVELINTYLKLDEKTDDDEYRKYISMMISRNKEYPRKTK